MSNVEKNYIKAGQRLKKIIIDNIGEPELLGDIQKKFKNIKTTGTSTDKVFTLNKTKIKKENRNLKAENKSLKAELEALKNAQDYILDQNRKLKKKLPSSEWLYLD